MLLVGISMVLYLNLQASMLLPLRPYSSTTTTSRSFWLARRRHHNHQAQRFFARRSSLGENINSSSSSSSNSSNNLLSSPQSNTIKRIQALLSKRKKRNEWQQVVVEGPRMVLDLYANPRTRSLIRQVVISEDKWDTFAPQLDNNVRLLPATAEVLQSCTDTVTNQGIVAVCDIPNYDDDESDNNSARNHRPLILILDGVSDPGNVGTLLRSALATGVASVVFLPDSCDPWNPKAVRSAMGATFLLRLRRAASWSQCLEQLQLLCGSNSSSSNSSNTCQIYAATMLEEEEDGDGADDSNPEKSPSSSSSSLPGIAHYDVDWAAAPSSSSSSSSEPVALVIGSEGNGLTPPLRQAVQRGDIAAIHVPMEPAIESLNAAVCGSVILFEYHRQVREAARARRRHDQT